MFRWMFGFSKSYLIGEGHVYNVWSFDRYVYSKEFSPYQSYGWMFFPTYFRNKIIEVYISIVCCTFLGRDVGRCMNSTCIQLHITSTYAFLSPAGSSGFLVWTWEDARITPAFNSMFLLEDCYHHIGDLITIIIYLKYVCIMLLRISVHASSAYLRYGSYSFHFIFKFVLLCHILLGLLPSYSVSS